MIAFVILAALAALPAAVAHEKGRSVISWWMFGVLLLPAALVACLCVRSRVRDCPYCGQVIPKQAGLCPHCRGALLARQA